MSVTGASGLPLPESGLPVVNQALEPAWVRHGSASTQKSYQTALAFEEMLVEQLSKSLTATSGLEGESGQGEASAEGGSSAGGSSGPFSSMLPQALTSGVMSAGGLGLAAQMTRQMDAVAGTASPGAAGGATADTSGGGHVPAGADASAGTGSSASAGTGLSATGGTGA
jgi:Rod binding domain-containing protein